MSWKKHAGDRKKLAASQAGVAVGSYALGRHYAKSTDEAKQFLGKVGKGSAVVGAAGSGLALYGQHKYNQHQAARRSTHKGVQSK